jgi:hypothetical protein
MHSTHEPNPMWQFILEVVTCYDCPIISDPIGWMRDACTCVCDFGSQRTYFGGLSPINPL